MISTKVSEPISSFSFSVPKLEEFWGKPKMGCLKRVRRTKGSGEVAVV